MSLNTAPLLDRGDVKAFFISHDAMQVIEAMFTHTRAVAATYGRDSTEHARQADSLAHCLTAVLTRTGFGNRLVISRDSELSLYCNEDDRFFFGMIFHPDRSTTAAGVVPGTWSLHS
jgi:hypothetical protein